jgi:hypothetical protein
MRKTLRLKVLYPEGSDPFQENTEWREITITSEKWWPTEPSFCIEEFSGFEKKKINADTATLFSGTSFSEVLDEYDRVIDRLRTEGFVVYDPRTWRTS